MVLGCSAWNVIRINQNPGGGGGGLGGPETAILEVGISTLITKIKKVEK